MEKFRPKIPRKTKFFNFFRQVFKIKKFESLIINKNQEKDFVSVYKKLIPPNYLYPKNSWRLTERDLIKYRLDISDYGDHSIYFKLKDLQRDKLYSLVKEGMIVFDIGANIGDTALHFSKIIKEEGLVVGFEPDKSNFLRAEQNIILNKVNNVKLFNIGLGNIKKTLKLYRINPHNSGMNKISKKILEYPYVEIRVEKLDQFIVKNKFTKIDLIKIDVEGFEMNVLKGGFKTLKKYKPLLFIELDDQYLQFQNSSASELVTYLYRLDYLVYSAKTNKQLTPDANYTNCHYDIYAIIK